MSLSSPQPKRPMRMWISIFLLIALGIIFWTYNDHHPTPGALPHISLQTLSGKKITLNNLHGKPIVINLWATWCPPCRAELPMLLRASQDHPGIRFYFVEQGNNYKTVAAFDHTIGMPPDSVLMDEDTKLSKFFGVIGYPTTIFYNASGNIAEIHRGELKAHSLNQILQSIKIGS